MTKKISIILLSFTLVFVNLFQVNKVSASASVLNNNSEEFYDSEGNKTTLHYYSTDEEFKVETYVNDILIDYAVMAIDNNNNMSSKIEYYTVESTEEPIIYDVEDFITEEINETFIQPFNTLDPGYPTGSHIQSKYNSLLDILGFLYRQTSTESIKKFHFDFAKDIAMSVVAAAITNIFSTTIVTIGVLLATLAVSYESGVLKDNLTGYYDAEKTTYKYLVSVSKDGTLKDSYYHNQHKVVTTYYNQKNGEQLNKTAYSGSWFSEGAILDIGIVAGS